MASDEGLHGYKKEQFEDSNVSSRKSNAESLKSDA
jgi:hypothetical protein